MQITKLYFYLKINRLLCAYTIIRSCTVQSSVTTNNIIRTIRFKLAQTIYSRSLDVVYTRPVDHLLYYNFVRVTHYTISPDL